MFSRFQDYRVLESIAECYRVLQSIWEYYRVLQSVTEYCRVFQSITKYSRVLESITECNRVLQSISEYNIVLQSIIRVREKVLMAVETPAPPFFGRLLSFSSSRCSVACNWSPVTQWLNTCSLWFLHNNNSLLNNSRLAQTLVMRLPGLNIASFWI